jgi:dUTP pyrophosphatase
MTKEKTLCNKVQKVIDKYVQVDAADQKYIPVEDKENFQDEMKQLENEYFQSMTGEDFDKLSDDVKQKVLMDTALSLIPEEEAPKEPFKYNDEKIKEEHQKAFDKVYRIDVEVMDGGQLPCKAHKTDAGFDLFATDDLMIVHGQITKHPLNIKMKLPEGTYAQITSKSGLGSKGLLVYAGIIDESYRGIPHVVCTMLAGGYLQIKKGQKIAQLIMHPYSSNYYMAEVDKVDEDTERGDGGFGSSGV